MGLIKKVFIGVLLYFVCLLWLVPARVVVGMAPLPSHINISEVSGTLWQGQADIVVAQRHFEQVSWLLRPLKLLTGTLVADVVIGNNTTAVNGEGTIGLSSRGLQVDNVTFDAPYSFLLANTRLPFKTTAQGDLRLQVQHGEQGTPWCEALTGTILAQQTQVNNQFGQYPLGDMEFSLGCQAGQLQLNTVETKNTIGLHGSLLLGANQQINISAKIQPTSQQPQDLRDALLFLGKPDKQGYYAINFKGKLPRF